MNILRELKFILLQKRDKKKAPSILKRLSDLLDHPTKFSECH